MVTVTIHVPYTRDKTTEAQGGTQPGLVVPGLNPSVECMCQTTAPHGLPFPCGPAGKRHAFKQHLSNRHGLIYTAR